MRKLSTIYDLVLMVVFLFVLSLAQDAQANDAYPYPPSPYPTPTPVTILEDMEFPSYQFLPSVSSKTFDNNKTTDSDLQEIEKPVVMTIPRPYRPGKAKALLVTPYAP